MAVQWGLGAGNNALNMFQQGAQIGQQVRQSREQTEYRNALLAKSQREEQRQASQDAREQQVRQQLPAAIKGEQGALEGIAGLDPDAYFKVTDHLSKMGEAGVKRQKAKYEAAAPLLVQMQAMPYEQRRAYLQQAAPALVANGWTPEELQNFDPTDQAVQSLATSMMTVGQVIDRMNPNYQVLPPGSKLVDTSNPAAIQQYVSGQGGNIPPPPPGFKLDPPAAGGGGASGVTSGFLDGLQL